MEPLLLIDGQGEYPLGLHLEILEDPTGEMIIEDVHSPGFYSFFIPSQVEAPNGRWSSCACAAGTRLGAPSYK